MLEAKQSEDGNKWCVRLEGRILDALTQEQQLNLDESQKATAKRFLELFKRAKVEFLKAGSEERCPLYQTSLWNKTASACGSAFDCLQIERDFPPAERMSDVEFTVKISLWLDQTPERFKVSQALESVLGIREETRARIVAALWQYIKQNRLQDSNDRAIVNLNSELR